jgi:hypothetical protein
MPISAKLKMTYLDEDLEHIQIEDDSDLKMAYLANGKTQKLKVYATWDGSTFKAALSQPVQKKKQKKSRSRGTSENNDAK